MAWRPNQFVIDGVLDNTVPNKVTGWIQFKGLGDKVTFDLAGNFHRDIRGAKIRLKGDGSDADETEAQKYMEGFSLRQSGSVGDITAGLPPHDYGSAPYAEWYGDENGRVVIELEPDQIEVIGMPIPACESDPISREEQGRNMVNFLGKLAQDCDIPQSNAICVGITSQSAQHCRGHQLLPDAIRKQLPPLYSQDGKGGKAIVYVKFFVGSWTWWATEFDGEDMFFGLVEGFEKELGYFSLSELEGVKGPLGLPVERDLHWQPTPLDKIAPELFTS
ncbi:MAG: DUF2958 domain-containing protein [Sedimentisphaerales bacterium]|nr:DUF2958 domain-containing protein [Sedimentisphaerales bacterium]